MLCPSCGQDNPAGAAFCEECGDRLQPLCPSCGSEVRADAKFCRSCGAALAAVPGPTPGPAPPPAPIPAHPTSFANGRYQVVRFLGEGGKKKVYLAHDTTLDRDVAFALIKTEGLDETGRQRIRREAQAMGRLGSHPNIVSVFDLGEENGQPYMVTELMAGGDVEGLIEKAPDHRMPLEQALRIAEQVCNGLEFAHSKALIHRDLKPGNVWLTSPLPLGEGKGEGITAKIGDFGLAVALDRSRLTQAGMMVGTVSYMPPEQAMGGQPKDPSDLYSLGAMLYEMVTGRPPFVGDDSIAIISQHLNTPPVAPSWHRPDLPPGLEALILRLLEKDLTKRPASAAEVRQALESIDLSSARPEPVEGRPADGSTSSPRAREIADNPIYRRTFVGREAELNQLHTAFDNALSGQGSLTMVVGEPGIGKTALCEQLATYVALRGGRTLVGHCYEEGSLSLPYLAFVEALRTYVLARPPEALKEELGAGAADVARIVSEIRDRVDVEMRPPADPEEDRWRLLQAVTGFLRNAAGVQPILIVLEDLHWADKGTLDLLIHLARNLAGTRLVVIGTYRDVEVDRAHPLSAALAELRRVREFGRVLLRGLTPDEVHRMIGNVSGQETQWSFAEVVHRQTEGNPLFVQEVLRYLVEEGLVTRQEGRWQRTIEDPLATRIPEGLRDVIGKRLSRLGPECNRLLAIAAVIGRDFALETLRRVAELEEEPLIAAIEEALRVGVLEEQSRTGVIRYRFAHAFFRQTLYEEMSAPRRLRLHQQVARALEAQYAARLDDHAVEMAEHFAQSTDPADLAKAVHYGEIAAGRASAVYAYSEAARLLEGALEVQEVLDPDDKAKRCDLLLALGDALMPAGEPLRAAEEIAPEALRLGEALNDRERACHACFLALEGLFRHGGLPMPGTAVFTRWAELADRYAAPATVDRVRANLEMALVRTASGQLAESTALAAAALKLARQLDDQVALFNAACRLIVRQSAPQHQQVRFRLIEEFVSKPRNGVRAWTLCTFLSRAAGLYLSRGQPTKAKELWLEMEELALRTQDPYVILYHLADQAQLATVDGNLDSAAGIAGRLAERGDELGAPGPARILAIWATRALLHLGRLEEAVALIPQAYQMAGAEEPPRVATRRALLLAHMGRRAEAQAVLSQLLTQLHIDPEEDETALDFMTMLLETAVLVEHREAAALLAHRLATVADLAVADLEFTCIARHLGAAAALLGERETAKAYYQQALEVCAMIRFRPEIALTRLQLAELLLQEASELGASSKEEAEEVDVGHHPHPPSPIKGEEKATPTPTMGEGRGEGDKARADAIRKEAMEHLDFAISEFQEMKMRPSLERALRHKGLLKA